MSNSLSWNCNRHESRSKLDIGKQRVTCEINWIALQVFFKPFTYHSLLACILHGGIFLPKIYLIGEFIYQVFS